MSVISIHAPLAGCDITLFWFSGEREVFQSTHPLRGATPRGQWGWAWSRHFNPRTPRGVRLRQRRRSDRAGHISIHAPLAGCDGSSPSRSLTVHPFQSTHPLRGARFSPAEFQHIAGAGHTQCPGKNAHIPGDEEVSPALVKSTVVGVFVKDRSVGGAEIFCPLVLDMDKRPLAAAELEVLQTGELEEILLGINHPIRVQVTPSGSFSSSTVTA